MPKDQLTGVAIGGPRDKVKLSAGLSWNGRIEQPKSRDTVITKYFPGKYQWDLRQNAWVWIPNGKK